MKIESKGKSGFSAEKTLTEFEFHFWRAFYAFLRWQENCEKTANDNALTGHELVLLHLICMTEAPKSISDIGQLLNRDDQFNLMYSLRKLVKRGLINKIKQSGRTGHFYQVTEAGIKKINDYSTSKKNLLLPLLAGESDLNLEELTKKFIKIKAVYDEAAHGAGTHSLENIFNDAHGEETDIIFKKEEESVV